MVHRLHALTRGGCGGASSNNAWGAGQLVASEMVSSDVVRWVSWLVTVCEKLSEGFCCLEGFAELVTVLDGW